MLVSAAAGSGKTAVLIERIINIILNGAAGVDQMLVVTFTNAAASEMKLKLTRAIRKAIRETDDRERKDLFRSQLDKLYRAYISTFHSFALRVIKEFFYEIDIEPNFKIADEVQSQLLQYEAMEELFDELFADDSLVPGGSFRDFLRLYSNERDEDTVTDALLATYMKLRSMPNYFDWAYEQCEALRVPETGYRDSRIFGLLTERAGRTLSQALESACGIRDALKDYGCEKLAAKIDKDVAILQNLIDMLAADGLTDELFAQASCADWAKMSVTKDEKEAFEPYKEDIKRARDDGYKFIKDKFKLKYADPDLASRFAEMEATYPWAVYYLNLLKAFEERFDAKKRDAGVLDFSDIEHIAASILSKPQVAAVMRERFRFIFIDEYQDTNYLQEYLIDQIARPDNVFKVGDVKQSIYGFRQSEPQIFVDTAERYASEDRPEAMTIHLNKNFRSNGRTIAYINDVFRKIMPGYDANTQLYQGLSGHADYDFKPEFHILIENPDKADEEDDNVVIDNDGDEAGEEILDRTRTEAEAAHVAKEVAKLIGTTFHDGLTGTVRQVTPRDIVILMRSAKRRAEIYYKALKEAGITAHISDEDGYFDTVEIGVALSLLSVMDNMKQDIPLIAVLHSEIFDFTPSELAEVRAFFMESGVFGASRTEYSKALVYYAEHGTDAALAAKVRQTLERLEEWRELSRMMELDEFIWHLLVESNYYMYAGAMYGGRQRQANLRALVDRARSYRESGVSSLGDFIRYIDVLKKKDVKTGQAMMVSEEDDIVRIMTIHKSKGLEFPFVFVTGLGQGFRHDAAVKGFSFVPEIGAGISYVDRERHFWRQTLVQRLISDVKLEKERQEELRILYVAMTRAREKLILTGTVRDSAKVDAMTGGWRSYIDIMAGLLNIDSVKLNKVDLDYKHRPQRRSTVDDFLAAGEQLGDVRSGDLYGEVARRLGYTYPYAADLTARSKYSVSELRRLEREAAELAAQSEPILAGETAPLRPLVRKAKGGTTAAEIGTGYHRIMEYLDFARALDGDDPTCVNTAYINASADLLAANGAIPQEVYEKIDLERVESFFRSDVGVRAVQAARDGRLRKEKPFTLRMEHDGRDIMVQGIIDCCFIDPETGENVLIDYKSSYVRRGLPEDAEEQRIADEYREQIRIYSMALAAGTGVPVGEAYLYLFDTGRTVAMQ